MADPRTTGPGLSSLGRDHAGDEQERGSRAGSSREWNTPVGDQRLPRREAAAVADRAAPDLERIARLRRRAETAAARLADRGAARDAELIAIHAAAGRFFQACLHGSWVPGYLAERGLAAARRHGYADNDMLRSGLVTTGKDGRLHDRLMIPLRDEHGTGIAFIGRRHPDAADDQGPKYLNSPSTDLFIKGNVLAGLAEGRRALDQGAQPVLVEGPMDAIAVSIAAPGRFTGIAPSGTALTAEQVAALARATDLPARGIRVALDADAAGRAAAVRAYSTLQPVVADITAVALPDGQDPASLLKDHGPDALRDALISRIRVVDARIEDWAHGRDLEFTELQIGALRAAAAAIAAMPAADIGPQAARLAELFASRYGWTAEEVTREVITAVEGHYEPAMMSEFPAGSADLVSAAIASSAMGSSGSRRCHSRAPRSRRNATERG
jgi:DNA primase